MTIRKERIRELEVESLGDLIAESERSGFRFVGRLVNEWKTGTNRFDRSGEGLFAAWVGGQRVGICGLNVDPYTVEDRIGRVRHLYVLSAFRRIGVGRLLVTQVIELARGRFDLLRLRTTNPSAARLYEALGFRPAGEADRDATHVMDLSLDAPPAPQANACARTESPLAAEARVPRMDENRGDA